MAATDFDYVATRNEIIEGAFRIVGALETGQNLTAEMLDQGVKALQLLIKSWSNKHLFLWNFYQTTLTTVSSNDYYDLESTDPGVIGVDKAWLAQTSSDIPLEVVSYGKYLELVNNDSSTTRPQAVAYFPTPDTPVPSPRIYVWPTPDAAYTIKIMCPFMLKDFDTAGGSGDAMVKFQRALKYGLAEDLFDEYPGPMNEREYVQEKARELFREAKAADMPVETTNEVESLFARNTRG